MISQRAGWLFTFFVCVAFGLLLYGTYPKDIGHELSDRQLLDNLFASQEYEARLIDIQANITPLSLADLEGVK